MASREILSVRELRRRLREVDAQSYHLRERLPADSPYNRILTLHDIGRCVTEQGPWLRLKSLEEPPQSCERGCPSVNECRAAPPCRKIEPYMQKRLSAFFLGWDKGELVKACVGGQWRIVPRHQALAALAAQTGTAYRFEFTPEGPKLKL